MSAAKPGSDAPASAAPAPRAPRSPRPGLAERPGFVRRLVRPALVLITIVLVADALIGDKGLLEQRRQVRRREQIAQELEQRQRENQELRVRARRLREENPAAIEDLARRKLGMIKPGELLFVVKDVDSPRPPAAPPAR
jgi:cell division protein FtsB